MPSNQMENHQKIKKKTMNKHNKCAKNKRKN